MKVTILLSNGQELQDLIVKFQKPCSEAYITFSFRFDLDMSVEW